MRTVELVAKVQQEMYYVSRGDFKLRLSLYAGFAGVWSWSLYETDGGYGMVDSSYDWAYRNKGSDSSFSTASLAYTAGIEAFDAKVQDMTYVESNV